MYTCVWLDCSNVCSVGNHFCYFLNYISSVILIPLAMYAIIQSSKYLYGAKQVSLLWISLWYSGMYVCMCATGTLGLTSFYDLLLLMTFYH